MNTRKPHFYLVLALSLLALVGVLTVWETWRGAPLTAQAQGTIRYVAIDGNDSGDCTAAPCRTVQYAVDQTAAGDEIRIAAGTYTGVQGRSAPPDYPTVLPGGVITQVVYISQALTLRGGFTTTNWVTCDLQANPTTLDAQGRGRAIFISAGISPTIEGLRIIGGNAARLGGHPLGPDAGGGVFVVRAGATIRDCWVFSNTAYYGGGLALYESAATLRGNTFTANDATYGGGLHVYMSPAVLGGNAINANRATWGGGLYLEHSAVTLSGNTFAANTAYSGGGLSQYGSGTTPSVVTLDGNTFVANTADHGGGLSLFGNATGTNNVVVDNRASTRCSGIAVGIASLRLRHTTIARNGGGDGSGICVLEWPNTITLTDTILVSHTVGITVTAGNTVTLEATLWGSGAWANGTDWAGAGTVVTGVVNLWGDPGFVAPDAGDYHIGLGSAALDAGVDAGVRTDVDGEPRPYLVPDLGADEYWPPGALQRLYLPLVLRQSAS
jgi:hypothetical protein